MRKILLLFLAVVWLIPGTVMAHSTLETAVPAIDAIIEASPEKVELTYNTKIEKLSSFKILNAAGEEVKADKTVVDGATMSRAISEALPNDTYTVKWTIIGADGHSVSGEYLFKLDAPLPETTEPTPDAAENAQADTAEPSPEATSQPADETPAVDSAEEASDDSNSGSSYTSAIIVGVIIVAVALILLLRKRKA